jgi:hypothetical protein
MIHAVLEGFTHGLSAAWWCVGFVGGLTVTATIAAVVAGVLGGLRGDRKKR